MIEDLKGIPGVSLHCAGDDSKMACVAEAIGASLPRPHIQLLCSSNGIEAYHGYFRLFGIFSSEGIDGYEWNQESCWKFAWSGRCSGYYCFAETAWGDQYAYSLDGLKKGDSTVYFLEGLAMTPEVAFRGFEEFFANEYVRCAKAPYDQMIVEAHRRFGRLGIDEHLAYVPSPLLGGEETPENIMRMNAVATMICNGDTAVQLDAGPEEGSVSGVEPYEDDRGRTRLRLLWE